MKALGSKTRWLAAPALALLPACGVSFDPPSELQTLRVLAVQKDVPYPAVGDTVNLSMLWHDASEDRGRPIEVAWLPECKNPPGGLYYGCFLQLQDAIAARVRDGMPPFISGSTFSIDVEEDILTTAPEPAPGQPRYGLTFVFFAACAGTLSFDVPDEEGALPLICLDDDGVELGPEDFVAGYTSLFTFPEGFRNGNPVVNPAFTVAGEPVGAELCTDRSEGACIPDADAPAPPEIDCDDEPRPAACVRACEDDGEPECPEIDIRPDVDQMLSTEPDEVARTYFDRDVGEQMWINYYVDRGGVKSDVRLLNDAMVGWNDDYGTKFFAPSEPGPVTVWAVAHDNRGGVAWVRTRLEVYTE